MLWITQECVSYFPVVCDVGYRGYVVYRDYMAINAIYMGYRSKGIIGIFTLWYQWYASFYMRGKYMILSIRAYKFDDIQCILDAT